MTTTKTHTAEHPGPITLDARLASGAITVTVEDRTHAVITIATADNDGTSANAVNAARINDSGTKIAVGVDTAGGGSGGVVIQSGGVQRNMFNTGGGVMIAGNNYGVISTGNGSVVIGGGAVVIGGSPIFIEAKLPVGSSLLAETTDARVETTGSLDRAQVRTMSGHIRIDAVTTPDLHTMSGHIDIRALYGDGRAETMSGRITVVAAVECALRARSMSGDIEISGARVDLDASTMSGRLRTR
ncbi:hypothetical protein BDK92_7181 [Micromonospora pisi]|uniref:DUF4097 domain-containing protein n=1 Tax=Micromonospora pisi TaxID=589240 RepID=A0A495JUN4_9ACTN|nr:DUF4097 family beta strand repeat-containing protein [Micromonospora pisi]RKR92703.1 hypothetical protein BDK92_7181 [Micromonospora pisi]